jgi:heat-inducible transcriptional repressor
MSELDPRKQTILRAIVFEYISAAEPVASEQLVQKYDLGVKSATVRNEMAEMSELGYLEQPHTSAGRIPSDRGYRYYVDRLILQREPELAAKQRLKDAAEEGDALQSLLRDTTKVLSRLTHQLSAATIVRDGALTIRNAVISALGPQQALLVLVLNNGHVENRMIECPPGLTLQEIGQVNEALSQATAGKALRSLLRTKAPAMGGQVAAEKLVSLIWTTLRSMAKELTRGGLVTEGEEFMFGQPEFQRDVSALMSLLDSLKDSDVLYEALSGPGDQPQTVRIGRENKYEQLHQLSVVRQSFFVGENEAGTIAIIGPTRMAYDASIPLVNYTARALTESLTRFFG